MDAAERFRNSYFRRYQRRRAPVPVERFTSDYLDAIARRGAGWWAVAPKGTAPELDGDVDTDLGADVAEWMEEEE